MAVTVRHWSIEAPERARRRPTAGTGLARSTGISVPALTVTLARHQPLSATPAMTLATVVPVESVTLRCPVGAAVRRHCLHPGEKRKRRQIKALSCSSELIDGNKSLFCESRNGAEPSAWGTRGVTLRLNIFSANKPPPELYLAPESLGYATLNSGSPG